MFIYYLLLYFSFVCALSGSGGGPWGRDKYKISSAQLQLVNISKSRKGVEEEEEEATGGIKTLWNTGHEPTKSTSQVDLFILIYSRITKRFNQPVD